MLHGAAGFSGSLCLLEAAQGYELSAVGTLVLLVTLEATRIDSDGAG